MHIMTANGWRPLVVKNCTTPPDDSGRYIGSFPSKALCTFVNAQKDRMLHFDDGKRMAYVRSAAETPIESEAPAVEAPPAKCDGWGTCGVGACDCMEAEAA